MLWNDYSCVAGRVRSGRKHSVISFKHRLQLIFCWTNRTVYSGRLAFLVFWHESLMCSSTEGHSLRCGKHCTDTTRVGNKFSHHHARPMHNSTFLHVDQPGNQIHHTENHLVVHLVGITFRRWVSERMTFLYGARAPLQSSSQSLLLQGIISSYKDKPQFACSMHSI